MTGERTLPGIGLTGYWNLGDSTWKPGMDVNLRNASALIQLAVKTRTTSLPGSPSQGDIHLVPSGAGSHPNEIAIRDNGAWVYLPPIKGMRAYSDEDAAFYFYNGSAWMAESSGVSITLAGDVSGASGSTVVGKLRGVTVSSTGPTTDQILAYDGSQWVPTTPAAAVTSVTMSGDVTGGSGANTVAAIRGTAVSATSPTSGYVLAFDGSAWTPTAPTVTSAVTMTGDVTGSSSSNSVVKLQGRALAGTSPSDGQVIAWDNSGSTWKPVTPSSGITDAASDGVSYVRKNGAWVAAYSAYDLPIYIPDRPTTGMTAARIVAPRPFSLPSSLTGSYASANTGPTASATFSFQRNGTEFATCVFTPGSTVGAYTSVSGATFAAGDVLRVLCPTQDTTLADISFTLVGTRT